MGLEGRPAVLVRSDPAAYVFRNDHDAGRAFADRDELVAYTAPLRVGKWQPLDLGNEAELLRGGGLNYPGTRS